MNLKGSEKVADKGWIKLHRQLQECPIWYGERFSKGQAWVDLLLLANHRDKKILFNGEMIVIQRGQYLTSTVKLAEKWGWNRKTVSSYLKLLEQDKMITKVSDNTKTLITIENYEVFQCFDETDGQFITQPNGQPIGQQTDNHTDNNVDNPLDTNKNDKNIKNDKNVKNINNNNICAFSEQMHDDLESFFESIWQLYPIKKGKGAVHKAKKQVLQRIGYDEIKRCVERYVSEMTENKTDKQYWKHGSTFFNSGYVDYLDKNYGGTSDGCTIGNDADKTVDEVEEAYYRAFFGK